MTRQQSTSLFLAMIIFLLHFEFVISFVSELKWLNLWEN